ncbi:MAG: hypothetical protein LQ345_001430 [Seirophora villosa]|nr:MAG: hypothetical protein LQ345_001430 [Seirophora villosa]
MAAQPTTTSTTPSSNTGPYTADTYTRHPDHTPQTSHPETDTYILTLHTDPAHHKTITALRTRHFPSHLNKLSAHIALFRALPGSELPTIETAIRDLVRLTRPFPIETRDAFPLAHGVGLEVHAPPAKQIFRTLEGQWGGFLSRQDRGFRAHYTLQNKVDDGELVRKTLEEVRAGFEGSTGTVEGLALYSYQRGYWKLRQVFPFTGGEEEVRQKQDTTTRKMEQDEWPALPGS